MAAMADLGIALRAHLDEREAARTAGLAVARDGHLLDGAAVRSERGTQRVLGDGEVEVADVELGSHVDRFVRSSVERGQHNLSAGA